MAKPKKEAYVVFIGRVPGVYRTWAETKLQVDGYPAADFRGYFKADEAEQAWAQAVASGAVGKPRPEQEGNPSKPITWRLWNLKAGKWASEAEHAEFMLAIAEKCTRVAAADTRVKELARAALVPLPVGDTTTIEQRQALWNMRHPQFKATATP